jgi:hypothetical protein
MDTQKCIRSLKKLCKDWGGSLELVSEEEYDNLKELENFSDAPFTHADLGVMWDEKRIVFTSRCEVHPVGIIHEMGHVFADLHSPTFEASGSEMDFLGWEVLVARKVRISLDTWFEENKDYIIDIDDNSDLGAVPLKDRSKFAALFIDFSTKAGLVKNGKPVTIR